MLMCRHKHWPHMAEQDKVQSGMTQTLFCQQALCLGMVSVLAGIAYINHTCLIEFDFTEPITVWQLQQDKLHMKPEQLFTDVRQ